MSYKEKIHSEVEDILNKDLTKPQKEVLKLFLQASKENRKLNQSDIAKAVEVGIHEKEEHLQGKDIKSTKRQARQVVYDLRKDFQAPIVSSTTGYWLPESKDEAFEYVRKLKYEIEDKKGLLKNTSQGLGINI